MMLAMMMAVTFVGCSSDDPDPVVIDPTITVNGGAEVLTIDLEALPASAVVAVVSEGADLTSVKVFIKIGDGVENFLLDEVTEFEDAKTWSNAYIFTEAEMLAYLPLITEGLVLAFNVEAETADGGEKTVSLPIEIINIPPPTHPLGEPEGFTWVRDGATDGSGLQDFGLKFGSNANRVWKANLIKGAAEKFVQFTPAEWLTITTKEQLEDAITKGTDITTNPGVIVDLNNASEDIVLATKYKDEYYIMHITKAVSATGGQDQTVITITGDSKK